MNAGIPQRFLSVVSLGRLTAYYPPRSSIRRIWILLAASMFLAAGAAALYGFYKAYVHARMYGPAVTLDTLLWTGVIAFFTLLFGAISIRKAIRLELRSAAVYEAGFAYLDRKGIQSWRWADLAGVRSTLTGHYLLAVHIFTRHDHLLYRQDGTQLLMDDSILRVDQLVQAINKATYSLRLERAASRMNLDGGVSFGAVKLGPDRIRVEDRSIRWEELQSVCLKKGRLNFNTGERNLSALSADITNLDVLVEMMNERLPVKV